MNEIEKIKELCEPIIDYLKKNGSPYTEVHICMDEIKITSVELGIPINGD